MIKTIILGGTGMVGTEVVHQCLANNDLQKVVAVGRRPLAIEHPKLLDVKHENFLDFSALEEDLADADVCFYCLGVYQNRVSKDKFWVVTVDYLDAFLSSLERVNKKIIFCLFSAQGADPKERSPFRFAKAKGRAEQHLWDSSIEKTYVFRPGFINPGRRSTISGPTLWAFQLIYKLIPKIGIDAPDLAKVMIHVGLNGHELAIFENKDLRSMAKHGL